MITKREIKQRAVLSTAYYDYEKDLHKTALFKVHDHIISEDLVQDTFMKTWRYLVKGGEINTMKAFLYHILNDLIVDEYRKHKTTSLDALLENGFEPTPITGDSEQLADIFDGKKALVLIHNLSEKYQMVMRMKYMQLLSLKEISMATGQSRNTVAVQLHRGLKKLKSLYNHQYQKS